jgi:hypothetical protein
VRDYILAAGVIMTACATCGSSPCINRSFCAACRSADKRKARRDKPTHADNRPTPQVIIEAVMHAVHKRGPVALKEPATIERLSRCDESAKTEIEHRIANLQGRKPCLAKQTA